MRGVEPFLQSYWDWRAAGNFLGGGSGTGLLLAAALFAPAEGPWLGILTLLGLLLVGGGLLCVLAKLGRPWRALNVFFRPKTSWMTREAILAVGLFPVGLLGLLLQSRPLIFLAALLGLGFLYCQGRILKAARGIPAWREPLIVPLTLTTGLVEGGALLVLLTALTGETPLWAVAWLALLLVARVGLYRAYLGRLSAPGAAPTAAAEALARARRLVDPLGHWLPLAAILLALLVPVIIPAAPPHVFLVVAAVTAGAAGWYFKFHLITAAAYTQGFALSHAPARTPGLSAAGVQPGWE
jgi:phenylacetyl-CoA:acceptor oxidoreductase 26-kDa subunit